MKVTVDNYIELANRTNSCDYKSIVPRIECERARLGSTINEAKEVLNRLDVLKKSMFYGRGFDPSRLPADLVLTIKPEHEPSIDMLHGIIGIATEASELLECLASGPKPDVVNIIEECSDILWYMAIILKRAGVSFEHVMDLNIKKLAKRYPDGFSEFHAVERKLDVERQVMESVLESSTNHNFVD